MSDGMKAAIIGGVFALIAAIIAAVIGYVAVPRPAPATQSMAKEYSSGPKPSGTGNQLSGTYTVCSDDQPGYVIASSSFRLTGDRACNAWSVC